jgi:proteasome lid subunit RPN8/RPN11
MTGPCAWLAARVSRTTLARLTVAVGVGALLLSVGVLWYVGSVGLSMGAMAYDADDRTVVIDAAERERFASHYDREREVGWCLYGTTNETHVRVDEVVPARPMQRGPERVTFTCLPETAGQLLDGANADLIGAVHSHPGHDESELSRLDIALFGRISPLVEVMGVYTEANGTAYYTTDSMTEPLDTRVRDDGETESRPGRVSERPAPSRPR